MLTTKTTLFSQQGTESTGIIFSFLVINEYEIIKRKRRRSAPDAFFKKKGGLIKERQQERRAKRRSRETACPN